jgi:hypothetical protein
MNGLLRELARGTAYGAGIFAGILAVMHLADQLGYGPPGPPVTRPEPVNHPTETFGPKASMPRHRFRDVAADEPMGDAG